MIDGKVAFTGGMNIGDEYLGKGKLGYWREKVVPLDGDKFKNILERAKKKYK